MSNNVVSNQEVTLLELLDRLLDKGVVIVGDLVISVANVNLIYVGLRVLISSVETLNKHSCPHPQPLSHIRRGELLKE